eukprot:173475_1
MAELQEVQSMKCASAIGGRKKRKKRKVHSNSMANLIGNQPKMTQDVTLELNVQMAKETKADRECSSVVLDTNNTCEMDLDIEKESETDTDSESDTTDADSDMNNNSNDSHDTNNKTEKKQETDEYDICIDIQHPRFTKEHKRCITMEHNEILDIQRLNALSQEAQNKFALHLQETQTDCTKRKHTTNDCFMRLKCENRHKKTGRFCVFVCSVCGVELAADRSHKNIEITS